MPATSKTYIACCYNVPLKTMSPIAVILLICSSVVLAEDFQKKYLDSTEGLHCHKGFTTLSQKLKDAAAKCAQRKEIKDYTCYVMCIYHEFGYFDKNDKGELEVDHGMGSVATLESFDLTKKTGRDEYFKISLKRYECAENFLLKKNIVIPDSFDDKAKCEVVKDFFNCSFKSLTCDKASFE